MCWCNYSNKVKQWLIGWNWITKQSIAAINRQSICKHLLWFYHPLKYLHKNLWPKEDDMPSRLIPCLHWHCQVFIPYLITLPAAVAHFLLLAVCAFLWHILRPDAIPRYAPGRAFKWEEGGILFFWHSQESKWSFTFTTSSSVINFCTELHRQLFFFLTWTHHLLLLLHNHHYRQQQ